MRRVDDAVKISLALNPMGSIQKLKPIVRSTAAYAPPEVVYRLLEYSWFREIVSQNTYTATLPDGSTQIWQNTNAFLDPTSEYYNENVCGIKTGSLSDDYNLIVLYQQHGKEFLICSLGSQSDSSRYDDVNFILKTIDESYYLTQ